MSNAPRITRRQWLIGVAVLLLAVAVAWAAEMYRRHRHIENLKKEIRNAGGHVLLETPYVQKWFASWRKQLFYNQTLVFLNGSAFDNEWLRRHDDLSALTINQFVVGESPLSGSEVGRIVGRHPIDHLSIHGVRDSDAIAKSVSTDSLLRIVNLSGSDLSDNGFRMLPLETLVVIDVSNSDVTSDGLQELSRCRQLNALWLDGRQFDASVAGLLREQHELSMLCLNGEDVTDDHLKRIEGITVRYIELTNSSVTSKGVAALQEALPECRIRVRTDPDPDAEETAAD